jgi:hypothetical protein
VPKFWITRTEASRDLHTPFQPDHMVPADHYTLDGDWLVFTSKGHQVLTIRKENVARIEWIEDSTAEERKGRESAAYQSALRLIPPKIVLSKETDDSTGDPTRGLDFLRMMRQGVIVLDQGLPTPPEKLEYSDPVPVSYWTTEKCGAVQFIFCFKSDEGGSRPADVTLQFGRDRDGWYPVRSQCCWADSYQDAIGSSDFMRHQPDQAWLSRHRHVWPSRS